MIAQTGNAGQVAYWNGPHGKLWAKEQEKRDRDHAPMTEAGLALAAPKPGEFVLDIGCGSGTTTLKLAARVAPSGEAVGVHTSAPVLAVALRRAAGTKGRARLIQGDPTDYGL